MAPIDVLGADTQSGDVTKSIAYLVRDVRNLMEPNTATRLRVSHGRVVQSSS